MTDYAVVVGISRYPHGVGPDLDGPDHDAQAVRDWLVDRDGGGLTAENVRLIRSADVRPADRGSDPEPAARTIERGFEWVEEQTRADPGGRLYLYFSGHGFSPVLEEGALFTAEATLINPTHVYAHAWLRWFRTAQRFRESVLWMDCCMNRQQFVPVREVPLRVKVGTGVPGPACIAVAAQTGSALERAMPDGQVHGVFTWTLLHGLRGGAADERGRVTGESLKTFLHTVMPEFLPEDARASTSVDLQPFIRADEGMLFRRLPARPKYPTRIAVPPFAAGSTLQLWTGRPLARVASEQLRRDEWTGELLRGLYVAEVPDVGLRHGFQVSGTGEVRVAVSHHGPPVARLDGSELFCLEVVSPNPATSITVTDHRFDRVFTDTGELHEREMPGVYKVRTQFGRDVTAASEEIVLLDRDVRLGPAMAPQLSSPAPIPGTAATHEFQEAPFLAAAGRSRSLTSSSSSGAAISVLGRYWTDPGEPPTRTRDIPHPLSGLQLLDSTGRVVADLWQGVPVEDRNGLDPVAVWERELPAGTYFVRQTLPGAGSYEGCFVASVNWMTQIALRRATSTRIGTAQVPGGLIGDAAVFLRPAAGTTPATDQDAVVEAARLALAQGRNILADAHSKRLQELLLDGYANPIAGIVGAHLLLRALDPERPDPVRAQALDTAVANLRSMVGSEHPDVEALSLRCADPALRATRPFTAPPMFRHGWHVIAEASYQRPELVPLALWQRVHASPAFGAMFVWAVDAATRAAHARQLSDWISAFDTGEPTDDIGPAGRPDRELARLPDAVRDAARRLPVPALGAADLWKRRNLLQSGGVRSPDV